MDKFEYITYTFELSGTIFKRKKLDGNEIQKVLNKYGDEGWELVSKIDQHTNGWTTNVALILKRKKTLKTFK